MGAVDRFMEVLREGSGQLHEDHPERVGSAELVPTPNVIDAGDVKLFFRGVDAGLIQMSRGGRFNTRDRPVPGGRWALLSRSRAGGWFNAEYLPQIAAYVEAVLDLGYPEGRVLFELPARSLQLDLAVLGDDGRVVVLGEAKRSTSALAVLREGVLARFAESVPGEDSKRRGDEQRQLAWRLWTVRPDYTWLIGPGHREAFTTHVAPLRLDSLPNLPAAGELGLDQAPAGPVSPPRLV